MFYKKTLITLLACSSMADAQLSLYNDNFTEIRTHPDRDYILRENVDLSSPVWEPLNKTFSGRLNGNSYSFDNWSYSSDKSVAMFLRTDGAAFKNIRFKHLDITGNPPTPLVYDSVNSTVNGILVSGTMRSNTGSDRGALENRVDGDDGSAVSGVTHRGTHSIVANSLVIATIVSGSGGRGSAGGGDGGVVSGIMHSGTHSTVMNSLIAAPLEGGIGGEGVFSDGGKGGEVSGVMHKGVNSTVTNALIAAGSFKGGDGGYSIGVEFADAGGDGGAVSGVMHTGVNSMIIDTLVTATLKGGTGGIGYSNARNGSNGTVSGIASMGTTVLKNAFFDSTRAGVPGGNTTEELKRVSTYSNGFDGWRKVEGKYPFPTALDCLYLGARVNETVPLDCNEYACPSRETLCIFTDQSPGNIKRLLFDGYRYHGFVTGRDSLGYWASYEKNGELASLESCCGVQTFSGLNPSGIEVDAVANKGETLYVAYHLPDDTQTHMATYNLAEGFDEQPLTTTLSVRPTELLVGGATLYQYGDGR